MVTRTAAEWEQHLRQKLYYIAPEDTAMKLAQIAITKKRVEELLDGCWCDDGHLEPECAGCLEARIVLARLELIRI